MTDHDAAAIVGIEPAAEADLLLVAVLRELVHAAREPAEDLVISAAGDEIAMAMAALVPEAMARQRGIGIPEAVTLATLRDIGRKHRLYGAETVVPWLVGILRGDVIQVGRLQVERRAGAHGHALHIPESGALSPALVDDSLHRAAAITGAKTFSCESWLLDPRIGSAIPASNIAGFAARFCILDPGAASAEASAAVAKFVFRRSLSEVRDPAVVVPRSSLERLVASTLRGGEEWTSPLGVLTTP
ncbi:hypothetical protein HD600_001518 [Microbacterium ginsengiterrae]|uniref:Uncharacterized protein n=1 Tax=Microbacterium ginsengiterrae TaxID=546115 RepID=A0A7W9FB79_9MICO|nr:acyltransferase domain-containing protein [Microbacterium ginsengiterrae]MBB5743021.1 hypothetical protein [Microbacterium ginsengiterrae]